MDSLLQPLYTKINDKIYKAVFPHYLTFIILFAIIIILLLYIINYKL